MLSKVESWVIPAACRGSSSILKAAIREAVMAGLRMISLCSASEEHDVFSNRILSRGVIGEMLGLPDQSSQGFCCDFHWVTQLSWGRTVWVWRNST